MGRQVVWVRKCLRLHDNPALHAALQFKQEIYFVFILNPEEERRMGNIRKLHLHQSLQALDTSLQERHNNRLIFLKGEAAEILPSFIIQNSVSSIFTDRVLDPRGRKEEQVLSSSLSSLGVLFASFFSHTLFDLDLAVRVFQGNPPLCFEDYISGIKSLPPPLPLNPPDFVPPLPSSEFPLSFLPSPEGFGIVDYQRALLDIAAHGGEALGLERLKKTIGDPEWVSKFEETKSDPASIYPSTSLLSPYLSNGTLSPKVFYLELQRTYSQLTKRFESFSSSLFSQLHWREYFTFLSYCFPNFEKIEGNPLCRQISWDHNPQFLSAFEKGETGFPWIDSTIKATKQTGWTHHVARHTMASFLTRGQLWQSWERGRDYFEHTLLDYEWSICNANWLWMSASGLTGKRLVIYHPVHFPRSLDPPASSFVRHFLPVLANFPDQYIFDPWNAPLEVQERAGCIIGRDYPNRIVDHVSSQNLNAQRLLSYHMQNKEKQFPYGEPIKRSEEETNTAAILASISSPAAWDRS